MIWAQANCSYGNFSKDAGPHTYTQLRKYCAHDDELFANSVKQAKEKTLTPFTKPSVWGTFVEELVALRKRANMNNPMGRRQMGEWMIQKPSGEIVWYPFSYRKDGALRPPLVPKEWNVLAMVQTVMAESDGSIISPGRDRKLWFQVSQQWKAPVIILNNVGVQIFDESTSLAWQLLWWHHVRKCYSL